MDSTDEVKAELKDGALTGYSSFKDGGNGTPGWTELRRAVERQL